jgi:hypothetical protein
MNTQMRRILFGVLAGVLCAGAAAGVGFSQQAGAGKARGQAAVQNGGKANQAGGASPAPGQGGGNGLSLTMSEDELKALGDRIVAAQHKDDLARDTYERVEHHVVTSGDERRLSDDKTYRVIPTGSGTMKLVIKNGSAMADPRAYRQQLQDTVQVLEIASNPNDPREKSVVAKSARKNNERKELVDAARKVFKAKLVGREMRGTVLVDILELTPDPNFQPHSWAETALMQTHGKIWVQEETGQLLHGEAEVVHDVSFGGGILGKLYKGTHVSADNVEVDGNLWLPRRAQFDYSGRKFVFMFETHEFTEVSHYRYVGGPVEELGALRKELTGGAEVPGDP